MTTAAQLMLPFGRESYRVEIPCGRGSWRNADGTVTFRTFYACCIDCGWPWWKPRPVSEW